MPSSPLLAWTHSRSISSHFSLHCVNLCSCVTYLPLPPTLQDRILNLVLELVMPFQNKITELLVHRCSSRRSPSLVTN